jgi:hypothetical protein
VTGQKSGLPAGGLGLVTVSGEQVQGPGNFLVVPGEEGDEASVGLGGRRQTVDARGDRFTAFPLPSDLPHAGTTLRDAKVFG